MNLLTWIVQNPEIIVFGLLFLLVFWGMVLEFKLTSPRSWLVLLAFTALGGLAFWQSWRRKLLLKELAERERALTKMANRYRTLKEQARISEAAYNKAMAELERVRKDAFLEILNADAEYAKRLAEIRRSYRGLTAEETATRIRKLLGEKP